MIKMEQYERAMQEDDLGVFGILKLLEIATFWLVSCQAARGELGKDVCQTWANVTGSEVIASDASQIVTNWQGIELFVSPYGNIDDFEGTVFSFAPGRAPLKGIDPEANYRLHVSGGSAWDG